MKQSIIRSSPNTSTFYYLILMRDHNYTPYKCECTQCYSRTMNYKVAKILEPKVPVIMRKESFYEKPTIKNLEPNSTNIQNNLGYL